MASKVQCFLLSCSQKHICQDRHRAESKLLGRFAPPPQCLTALTYWSLSLQPQPRTHGSTVSPPQVRHGNETTQKLRVRDMLCPDTGKTLQYKALNYFRIYMRPAIQLHSSIQFFLKCAKGLHFHTAKAALFLETENQFLTRSFFKAGSKLFYSSAYPGLTCSFWAIPDERIEVEHCTRLIWTAHTEL